MDFRLYNCGSVWLLRARSTFAQAWVRSNLPRTSLEWAGAIVVEPRFVAALVDGIIADGFTVEIVNEEGLAAMNIEPVSAPDDTATAASVGVSDV